MISKSQGLPENPKIVLPKKDVREIVENSIGFWQSYSKDYIKEFSKKYLDEDIFGGKTKELYKEESQPVPDFISRMDTIDSRLHKEICMEALDYLYTKRSKKLLEKTSLWCLYVALQTKGFAESDWSNQKRWVFMSTITLILWTPWQQVLDEFKNKKPKGFSNNA